MCKDKLLELGVNDDAHHVPTNDISCHDNTATSYVSHGNDYAIHAHDDNTITTPLQKWCVFFFFGFCFLFVNTN